MANVGMSLFHLLYIGSKSNPAVIKYYDYVKEREMIETVPEMIPEFIVPSLANFKV